MEVTFSSLGHLVRQQQEQDEIDDARTRGTSHSKSRADTRRLAQEKAKGFD